MCSRIVMAIVSGCASGVMGLTGLIGIVFYIVTCIIVSLSMWMKAARSLGAHEATRAVGGMHSTIDGIGQRAHSFVLFWTYAHAPYTEALCATQQCAYLRVCQ